MGDHLRKRRLDLGLRQNDLAQMLGANVNTVTNWEVGRSTPVLRYMPGIIRFLEYVPFSADGALAEQLKAYRRVHGLSQKRLAATIGVDPSTVWHWEQGAGQPRAPLCKRVEAILPPRPVEELDSKTGRG